MGNRLAALPLLGLLLLLALTWIAYAQGLHGGFLFDDFGNLPAIGATGPVDNWPTLWRYLTSGTADPTGRPLTLLTFLLDARDWPADPYPFKLTNVFLHLLNGTLLYALLIKLGQVLGLESRRIRTAALLGTALWLLHPLLVSTTLYIVQREAMLPATCALAGLLVWLHGRSQLIAGRTTSGLLWSCLGLGGFTLLGTLSKANGALLPLYALLIELIIASPRQSLHGIRGQQAYRSYVLIFMVVPSVAILAYLTWVGVHGSITGGPSLRSWSYAQRLLTEPRVLMDYLQLLWLPRPFSSGLFNDQYTASTSLLHPASTLPAILAVATLIAGAWWLRRRRPALALAILFYFAGELIESTSIPLELYFEHRNYVPAMLMFWPLGLWVADTRTIPLLKRALMIVLPLGLAVMTHARSTLWGDVQAQAEVWAQINPESPRAQANAAQIEMQTGHAQAAVLRLQKLLTEKPDEMQLSINLMGARCLTGGLSDHDLAMATHAMEHTANPGSLLVHWFDRVLPVAMNNGCPGLTPTALANILNAGLKNPKLADDGRQQDLIYLLGRISLAQGRPDAALADFTRALDLQVRPGIALEVAAKLGATGNPRQGLTLLDHYSQVQDRATPPGIGMPMLHAWVLAHQNYWPQELAHLRQQLTLDANAENSNTERSTPVPSTNH
ncbi:MAG: hypothetical protein ABS82_07485 [Rhodanobacter sp. SCN 67-45]|nr:MAG: hypothetical protein ABS82_07485 [Rhodanobacter sp. SCN 67-45]